MQRATMMAGREVGERTTASAEAVSNVFGDAGTQFFQCAVQDFGGRRLLDELDQRFDIFGILDTCMHYGLLVSCVCSEQAAV